jgi:hypothetical protein
LMRLSAFLEAWVQLVLQEGNRVVPKGGFGFEFRNRASPS